VKTYSMQYGFTKIPFTVYVDIVYPWSIPVSMIIAKLIKRR